MANITAEPANQPFISNVHDGESYTHRIEDELLRSLPRRVQYSPRVKTARRWWWNIFIALILIWIFLVRLSLDKFGHPGEFTPTMLSLWLIIIIPIAIYTVVEYNWARDLQLLRIGIPKIAEAKSGHIDDSEGSGGRATYTIKYYLRTSGGGGSNLVSGTLNVSEHFYRRLTTSNPLFTVLHRPEKYDHYVAYAEITSGSIMEPF